MWARLRASKINKEKELVNVPKSFNVNEEYLNALRTKSYTDFFSRFKVLEKDQTASPSYSHCTTSEILLEPRQETIASILESPFLPIKYDLKALIHKYFDISAEASKTCNHLLKRMNQIQCSYQLLKQALTNKIDNYSLEQFALIIPELHSSLIIKNPFSDPHKNDFMLICEKCKSLLQHLKSNSRRVSGRIKLIECLTKTLRISITLVCGLVATAAIFLAVHSLSALIMAPALCCLPIKTLKKKFQGIKFLRSGILRKVGEQLDITAKATCLK
ncbi:hypothetical protein Ancab_036270 [Ancistrocladus abbreviatus]